MDAKNEIINILNAVSDKEIVIKDDEVLDKFFDLSVHHIKNFCNNFTELKESNEDENLYDILLDTYSYQIVDFICIMLANNICPADILYKKDIINKDEWKYLRRLTKSGE